jgi:hypothetical protein
MSIIREADMMDTGYTYQFLVDDPLALKSVPEELAEMADYSIDIDEVEDGWEISISRK